MHFKDLQDTILGVQRRQEVDLLGGGQQRALVGFVGVADGDRRRGQGSDDRAQQVSARGGGIQRVGWPVAGDVPGSRPVLALDGQIAHLVDDARVCGAAVDRLQEVVGSPPDVGEGIRRCTGSLETVGKATYTNKAEISRHLDQKSSSRLHARCLYSRCRMRPI